MPDEYYIYVKGKDGREFHSTADSEEKIVSSWGDLRKEFGEDCEIAVGRNSIDKYDDSTLDPDKEYKIHGTDKNGVAYDLSGRGKDIVSSRGEMDENFGQDGWFIEPEYRQVTPRYNDRGELEGFDPWRQPTRTEQWDKDYGKEYGDLESRRDDPNRGDQFRKFSTEQGNLTDEEWDRYQRMTAERERQQELDSLEEKKNGEDKEWDDFADFNEKKGKRLRELQDIERRYRKHPQEYQSLYEGIEDELGGLSSEYERLSGAARKSEKFTSNLDLQKAEFGDFEKTLDDTRDRMLNVNESYTPTGTGSAIRRTDVSFRDGADREGYSDDARDVLRHINMAKSFDLDTQLTLNADSDSFFSGMGVVAKNPNTYLANIPEALRNIQFRKLVDKMMEGGGYDSLTKDERLVVDAWQKNAEAHALLDPMRSSWFKGGQGAAQSIEFMAEMAVTGGIIDAASKGILKAALRKGLIKGGKELAGKTVMEGLTDFATKGLSGETKYLAEQGVKFAEGLVKAPLQSALNVPMQLRSYGDALLTFDENGNLPGWSEARKSGLFRTWEEMYTENGVAPIWNVLMRYPMKWAGVAMNRLLPGAYKSLTEMYTKAMVSGVGRMMRAAGFQGLNEEVFEEFMNALIDETAGNKGAVKDFFTKDNLETLYISFAPITLIGGGAGMAQVGMAQRNYENVRKGFGKMLGDMGFDRNQIDLALDGILADPAQGHHGLVESMTRQAAAQGAWAEDGEGHWDFTGKWKELSDLLAEYRAAATRKAVYDGAWKSEQDAQRRDDYRRLYNDAGTDFSYRDEYGGQEARTENVDGDNEEAAIREGDELGRELGTEERQEDGRMTDEEAQRHIDGDRVATVTTTDGRRVYVLGRTENGEWAVKPMDGGEVTFVGDDQIVKGQKRGEDGNIERMTAEETVRANTTSLRDYIDGRLMYSRDQQKQARVAGRKQAVRQERYRMAQEIAKNYQDGTGAWTGEIDGMPLANPQGNLDEGLQVTDADGKIVKLYTWDELYARGHNGEAMPTEKMVDDEEERMEREENGQMSAEERPSALERIPKDGNGNPVFGPELDPSLAWDALVEYYGNEADALADAEHFYNQKKGEVTQMTENKEKSVQGNTPAERKASRAAINEQIDRATKEMNFWNGVMQEAKNRKAEQSQTQNETQQQSQETPQTENQETQEKSALEEMTGMTYDQIREAWGKNYADLARSLAGQAKAWGLPCRILISRQEFDKACKDNGAKVQSSRYYAFGVAHDGTAYICVQDIFDYARREGISAEQKGMETLAHEGLAHIGMKLKMGTKEYGDYCDRVFRETMTDRQKEEAFAYQWDTNMTDAQKRKYLGLDGNADVPAWKDLTDRQKKGIVNGKDETSRGIRRGAADEYIASVAEKVQRGDELDGGERKLWERIVDWFRQTFGNALTERDIAEELAQVRSMAERGELTGQTAEGTENAFSAEKRGYEGRSQSTRAKEAREEGKFPMTDFTKEYDIPKESVSLLTRLGLIDDHEWHHTGPNYARTTFYGWSTDGALEAYRNNKKELDRLAREYSAVPETERQSDYGHDKDNIIPSLMSESDRRAYDTLLDEHRHDGNYDGEEYDRRRDEYARERERLFAPYRDTEEYRRNAEVVDRYESGREENRARRESIAGQAREVLGETASMFGEEEETDEYENKVEASNTSGRRKWKRTRQYFTGSIRDLVAKAKLHPIGEERKIISGVSDRLIKDAKKRGIKLDKDYRHVLTDSEIRHTFNHHGGEKEYLRGQVPITDEDFEKIPDIIDNYKDVYKVEDDETKKRKYELPTLRYEKEYDDGTIIYLEEVRKGKKDLAFKTLYKTKKRNPKRLGANRTDATPIPSSAGFLSEGKGSENSGTSKENGENSAFSAEERENMTSKQIDDEYFRAMEAGDEATMREMLDEVARRNGYGKDNSWRYYHTAPSRGEAAEDGTLYTWTLRDVADGGQVANDISDSYPASADINGSRDESMGAIQDALSAIRRGEDPTVTIYRAVPKGVEEGKVRNGDWVTMSRAYAEEHGRSNIDGDYRIIKEQVPASQLYWDGNDINEWGFDDQQDYRYRNTRNNRKLDYLVTRDDDGNVIPPSKRFDSRNEDTRFSAEERDIVERKRAIDAIDPTNADEAFRDIGYTTIPDKETLRQIYESIKTVTNERDGRVAAVYPGGFNKNYRENGLFAKAIPALKDAFKNSVLAYSEYADKYAGKERSDGSIHKAHPNVVAYHNYVGKVMIEGEEYYVRFTVAEEGKSKSRLHSSFVTSVDVYKKEQTSPNLSGLPSMQGINPKEVVDANLRDFFERARKAEEKLDNSENSSDIENPENDDRFSAAERVNTADEARERLGVELTPEELASTSTRHGAMMTALRKATENGDIPNMDSDALLSFLSDTFRDAPEEIKSGIWEVFSESANPDIADETARTLADLVTREVQGVELTDAQKTFLDNAARTIADRLGISEDNAKYVLWQHANAGNDLVTDEERQTMQDALGVSTPASDYEAGVESEVRYSAAQRGNTDSARDYYEKALSSVGGMLDEVYHNEYRALDTLVDAIAAQTGRTTEGWENPKSAFNQLSSRTVAQLNAYMRDFYDPMVKTAAAISRELDISMDDIVEYMSLKHGLERNRVFQQRAEREAEEKGKKAPARRDWSGITAWMRDEGRYDTVEEAEAAAQKKVDDYEKTLGDRANELWDAVRRATEESLRIQLRSGLMSRELYDSISSMFDYYIPLQGFADTTNEDLYPYYGTYYEARTGTIGKKAKGRTSKAADPFTRIGQNAQKAIVEAEKNRAKLSLYNFILARQDNDLATTGRVWYVKTNNKDADGKDIWEISAPSFSENDTQEEMQRKITEWEDRMRELEKSGDARSEEDRLSLGSDVVFTYPKDVPQHCIDVTVNGRRRRIYVKGNPRAAQAANGLLSGKDGKLSRAIQTGTRYLASIYTSLNPQFFVTNFARDVGYASANIGSKEGAGYGTRFIGNAVLASRIGVLSRRFRNGELDMDNEMERMYHEFAMNGGITGYSQMRDDKWFENHIKDALKGNQWAREALNAPLNAFRQVTEDGENLLRFAAYITSRQAGRSVAESVADAKDATVNFNRRGTGRMITADEARRLIPGDGLRQRIGRTTLMGASLLAACRPLYAFFNVAVQGMAQMIQNVYRHPGRTAATLAGYFGLGLMQAMMHGAAAGMFGGDPPESDDWYWNLTDWERRNNIIIPTGGGNYIKIPMAQELRVFYGLGDMIGGMLAHKTAQKNIPLELLGSIGDMLPVNVFGEGGVAQSLSPTLAAPVVDVLLNTDYRGSNIIPERYGGLKPKWEYAYRGTADWAVTASRVLNALPDPIGLLTGRDRFDMNRKSTTWHDVSPEALQHYAEGYLGGVLTFAEMTLQTGKSLVTGDDVNMRSVPFVNRFYGRTRDRDTGAYLLEMNRYAGKVHDTVRTELAGYGRDRDRDAVARLRDSKDFGIYRLYEGYGKTIRDLGKAVAEEEDERRRMTLIEMRNGVLSDLATRMEEILYGE